MPSPVRLQSGVGGASITEHGAHLLSWQTSDGQEQLYLSPRAVMDGRAAIRGGVPVCFPQFNMRVLGQSALPKHGFVRNTAWTVVAREPELIRLELVSNQAILALWPYAFRAGLEVRLAQDSLCISMDVVNTGLEAFSFAVALHTYLHVSDIHATTLLGLEDCAYWDAVKNASKPQTRCREAVPLQFGLETDRVYANAPRQLQLADGGRVRRITHSDSLPDTVVWNPGEVLCAQLADMPAQGWQQMLCVEAACIERPVRLLPNQSWQGWQRLERLPSDA
jgi:glucose-6-phosphate 1-epimerase